MNIENIKIAIVGATGNVGRILGAQLLQKKLVAAHNLEVLASKSSHGKKLLLNNQTFFIKELNENNLPDCAIYIFATNSHISEKYIPHVLKKTKAYVIDSSSAYRLDPIVPLIIPSVNAKLINTKTRLFAHANCITSPIATVINTIHKSFSIQHVTISTYQSTSGAGFKAMCECLEHTKLALQKSSFTNKEFTKPIAFNIIPEIGKIRADGKTFEEYKIIEELKKVIDPTLRLSVTAVRVPVIIGHSIALTLQLNTKFHLQEIYAALSTTNQIIINKFGYHTPIEVLGRDEVFVGRIRHDDSLEYGLQLWLCADNLRVGAATDAVNIAEEILQQLTIQEAIQA